MSTIKPKKIWIIYAIIFAAHLCIAIFAGIHHEPWADEAQSWLIARDSHTLIDLLRAVKLEGTLPTSHLINKAFQLAGLRYEYIFVIPLVFSAIGVILLFCTDAPLWAKIMLPFSFFAVYQNAVVARQYALVFPAMMLIVLFYKKRLEVPVRYHLALFLLAITSSYGVVIACSLLLWDLIGMVRTRFNDPVYKKSIVPFFATGLVIAAMSYLSLPPENCSMILIKYPLDLYAANALLFHIENRVIRILFLLVVLVLLAYYFRRRLLQFFVIATPLIVFMIVVYQRVWHMTYVFWLLVSLMIIFRDDFKKTKKHSERFPNLLVGSIAVFMLAVQCLAGFYSIFYDYQNNYSPAKEVAKMIEPYVESGAVINRLGYASIAVSPYFDHSIFANDSYGKTYYVWDYNAPNDCLSEDLPDVVVANKTYADFNDQYYDVYCFDSHMIFKFNETEFIPYVVYVKKDI